jgi:hypothetical protein
MSSENLSYLGYEDLNDFTSQHSDFANLLVNKEGFIYKFQNFSWIDFILYSGSPNKAALLKQKNGDEVEIKLSVKEVFLTSEVNGSQKYYSVRIISDNFVNVASKTDPEITKKSPPKNSFNLNNLISEDAMTTQVETHEEQMTQVAAQVEEPASEKSSDFILNFPTQESIEEEPVIRLDLSRQEDEKSTPTMEEEAPIFEQEFKLNLTEDTFQEPSMTDEEPDTFLKTSESDFIKEEPEITFGVQQHELADSPSLESENLSSGFSLKHTISDEAEIEEIKEEAPAPINLNFLQKEEVEPEAEAVETMQPRINLEEETNLSFLKQATRHEVQESTEIKNKEEIISQIKHDIEEIDADERELTLKSQNQEPEDSDISTYMFNQNEGNKDKKSFTKTLKSLFAETQDMDNSEADSIQEPTAILKKNDEIVPLIPKEQPVLEENSSTRHSALGLNQEEENSLILEFMADTEQNIELFKQYHQSNLTSQANYTLIKIQSSAEILNLNDIINTIHSIKQNLQESEAINLDQLIAQLEEDVKRLSMHVESETV